ncbi:MAG: gamma-glutamyl-gamma-aminobutyrate hydrolase family protein [Tannerella sp.]|jgi:microsomal dipeptidase-like Zn-dependent dipeptidase/gamma-glutamyl-gamma-aminobutyrate hydrolase PuuD|nr:gamma-glutamyl-gamma-aminobutyrate hydrolase family protein [Tannerella sp.]
MSSLLNFLCRKVDENTSDILYRRPVIGISSNRKEDVSCIKEPYFHAVIMAGGAPVLLPVTTDIHALATIADTLDGLILSGGGDMDAAYFGEKPIPEAEDADPYRDEYDFLLLRLAFNRQLPVFGICRGHQVINVAFGGTLYQDIYAQFYREVSAHGESKIHEPAHYVKTLEALRQDGREEIFTHVPEHSVKNAKMLRHRQEEARNVATHMVIPADVPSKLKTALGNLNEQAVPVNSFHHQALKDVAPEFIITATSPDGLIEAIEHPEYPIFGVQWHPESMAVSGNETMLNLFRYHVGQAKIFAKAKRLHRHILTIDSHTDTPMISKTFDLGRKEGGKVNLPLMEEGRLDAVFMVAYVPQGARDDASLQKAYEYAQERLSKVIEQVALHSDRMGIAHTPNEAWRLKREGKKVVLLGVENGYAIGKDLRKIEQFKDTGVLYMTLCHNGDNDICDSAAGNGEWGGLSPFGRDVVAEMNRLGMMIDVSHASDKTIDDVLKYSVKPVIASHSSSRALCNHHRNLDDDRIRAVVSQGGVVQICLYKAFINEDAEKASLSDVIRHICHVVDIAGIDHVGIGSDFDGGGELTGCRSANELIQITMRLIMEGFDDESIAKIWGGNLLRVMEVSG